MLERTMTLKTIINTKKKQNKVFTKSFLIPPIAYIVGCRGVVQLGGLILGYSRDVPPSLRLVSIVFALVDKRVILVSYVKYGTQSIHL